MLHWLDAGFINTVCKYITGSSVQWFILVFVYIIPGFRKQGNQNPKFRIIMPG